MKRVEFAQLAGISPAMVTKYADQGLIKFSEPDVVDAPATLAALAGRLDEHKRQSALQRLETVARIASGGETPAEPAPSPAAQQPRSAKLEIDELKRDGMQLDLARKAGELIPIAQVETAIVDAISAMQAAFDLETRSTADALTIELALSPDRAAMLARRLRTLCNRSRQRFAEALLKLAGDETAAASAEAEADAVAAE